MTFLCPRELYLKVPPEGSIPLGSVGIASGTAATHEVNQQAPIVLAFLLSSGAQLSEQKRKGKEEKILHHLASRSDEKPSIIPAAPAHNCHDRQKLYSHSKRNPSSTVCDCADVRILMLQAVKKARSATRTNSFSSFTSLRQRLCFGWGVVQVKQHQ